MKQALTVLALLAFAANSILTRLALGRHLIAQLAVPVIAALAAVVLLNERVTPRLVSAGVLVLSGVALALGGRKR